MGLTKRSLDEVKCTRCFHWVHYESISPFEGWSLCRGCVDAYSVELNHCDACGVVAHYSGDCDACGVVKEKERQQGALQALKATLEVDPWR